MLCCILQVLTPEQDLWSTNQYSLNFWWTQQLGRSPLLVQDCSKADIVYIPLADQWAECNYFPDIAAKFEHFTANLHRFLPLLGEKPHFMALSRVGPWTRLDLEKYKAAGITMLTIEGDTTDNFITVPYPALYHHHDGLHYNRFITLDKENLIFESFGYRGHGGHVLEVREKVYAACAAHPDYCQHSWPDESGHQASLNALQFYTNASNAWFCAQPPGDSPTRRSTFDCLLAGSIPVFFNASSALLFPWSDMVDVRSMVLLYPEDEIDIVFDAVLPSMSQVAKQVHINSIAKHAHLYHYSLTPKTGYVTWDNCSDIDSWDDALTFGLKALLRKLQKTSQVPAPYSSSRHQRHKRRPVKRSMFHEA